MKPTVKHGGGNVMVWGCMTWHGVGYMCRINNTLDAELYRQILDDELTATIKYYRLSKRHVIVQRDNDPKHTAGSTSAWFKDNGIKVLFWPAQSPDMNPMEHLWNEVDNRLKKYPLRPSNPDDLWERIQDVWNDIETDVCQRLITTMPERVQDILNAPWGSYLAIELARTKP